MDTHNVVIMHNEQIIRHFYFEYEGKRSITQIKSFLLSLDIDMSQITNIEIIDDTTVEITMLKSNPESIISNIKRHIILDEDINPEQILVQKDIYKIEELVPHSLVSYYTHLKNTKTKLDNLNIKYRYRRFTQAMLNKITEAVKEIYECESVEDFLKKNDDGMGSGDSNADRQ